MKKSFLLFVILWYASLASAQDNSLDIVFTGVSNTSNIQLESIRVINLFNGGDTTLFWPDTVLTLSLVGIDDIVHSSNGFKVYQNYPNPVSNHTIIKLFVPEKDDVYFELRDLLGRTVLTSVMVLDRGYHQFRLNPGDGNLYLFSAH